MGSRGLCKIRIILLHSIEEYSKLKMFLEDMSDQTIEITPFNVAY